jgi:hypothetical protein
MNTTTSCKCIILDELVTIDHSVGRYPICYVLGAHIEFRPFDSPFRLYSFGPTCGTPLCTPSQWLRYVSHSVGEFTLLILGPSTYSPRCDCSYDFLVSCVLLLVRETQL